MAFLEPWLVGAPVCGRNLPEITASLAEEGVVLPWSYDRLDLPLAWIGQERTPPMVAVPGMAIWSACWPPGWLPGG